MDVINICGILKSDYSPGITSSLDSCRVPRTSGNITVCDNGIRSDACDSTNVDHFIPGLRIYYNVITYGILNNGSAYLTCNPACDP